MTSLGHNELTQNSQCQYTSDNISLNEKFFTCVLIEISLLYIIGHLYMYNQNLSTTITSLTQTMHYSLSHFAHDHDLYDLGHDCDFSDIIQYHASLTLWPPWLWPCIMTSLILPTTLTSLTLPMLMTSLTLDWSSFSIFSSSSLSWTSASLGPRGLRSSMSNRRTRPSRSAIFSLAASSSRSRA